MQWCTLVFIFVMSLCFNGISAEVDYLGPADVILERIEECENPENFLHPMELTVSKTNRTHIKLDGCINLTSPLDNTVAINITIARWGDGGWKLNALNFFDSYACEAGSKYMTKAWHIILTALQVESFECPVKANHYCLKDFIHTPDFFYHSSLYGFFRADATVLIREVPFLCVRIYARSKQAQATQVWG